MSVGRHGRRWPGAAPRRRNVSKRSMSPPSSGCVAVRTRRQWDVRAAGHDGIDGALGRVARRRVAHADQREEVGAAVLGVIDERAVAQQRHAPRRGLGRRQQAAMHEADVVAWSGRAAGRPRSRRRAAGRRTRAGARVGRPRRVHGSWLVPAMVAPRQGARKNSRPRAVPPTACVPPWPVDHEVHRHRPLRHAPAGRGSAPGAQPVGGPAARGQQHGARADREAPAPSG